MKKKILSLLLAALLLFALSLPAFAGNGPFTGGEYGWAPAFLHLLVLDENGDAVTMTDEYGNEVVKSLRLFGNNTATDQPGAKYDKATNTLTLTDFHEGNYALQANMMGEDFTLKVEGDCRLAYVTCWSDEWGGGLHITGSGTLTVNENKLFDSAVDLFPEYGGKAPFSVDGNVTVKLFGKDAAIKIYAAETPDAKTDGKALPFNKAPAVREGYVWVHCYADVDDMFIRLAANANDPGGIYHMTEMWKPVETPDGEEEKWEVTGVRVERYIYLEKYDLYFPDYKWEDGGSLEFPSLEAAAAAGYAWVTDEKGEPVEIDAKGPCSNYEDTLYEDGSGNRYIVSWGENDKGESGEFAYIPQPIDGLDDFLLVYAPGVDPASLTEIMETYTLEDRYDFSYPEKEYVHAPKDPTPSVMLGDVNDDKAITAADARLALRRAVELETYAEGSREYLACDVDKKGGVTAADARLILRAAVELEDPTKW